MPARDGRRALLTHVPKVMLDIVRYFIYNVGIINANCSTSRQCAARLVQLAFFIFESERRMVADYARNDINARRLSKTR